MGVRVGGGERGGVGWGGMGCGGGGEMHRDVPSAAAMADPRIVVYTK